MAEVYVTNVPIGGRGPWFKSMSTLDDTSAAPLGVMYGNVLFYSR